MEIRLDDRVAVITGGAQGIGFGIAQCLAECGARIAILDLSADNAAAAAEILIGSGHRAISVVADVRDRSAVQSAMAEVAEEWGGIDILVNNAGVVVFKSFVDQTDADWDVVMQTNLRGAFLVAQEGLRFMRGRGNGSIINISSIAANHYTTVHSVYAAAKAGLNALTRDLAYELGPEGIRVNAIAPGLIETPLTSQGMSQEAKASYEKILRVGRWGRPDDIGNLTAFLASDLASFMTGIQISIAGGADLAVMSS